MTIEIGARSAGKKKTKKKTMRNKDQDVEILLE
jgi:hypothetical protein